MTCDNKPTAPPTMAGLAPHDVDALVRAAIHAPSADNRHVFAWQLVGEQLQLRARAQRTDALPHQTILDDLSLGCVAQNIDLQARALGLVLTGRWFSERAVDGAPLVRFSLARREAAPMDDMTLADAIPDRHSNRSLRFAAAKVPVQVLEALARECQAEGCMQHWMDDAIARRSALKAIRLAETARFADRDLHAELFAAIQQPAGNGPTAGEEGLPIRALGLAAFERVGFPLLRHWPLQRTLNLLGVHHAVALRAADLPCRLSPHLGAISCAGTTAHPAFQVGRALQRLWLRATALGLSMQVLAAAPIYAHAPPRTLDPRLIQQLRAHLEIACHGALPWVVFRLGRTAVTPGRAGRPPVTALAWTA